MAELINACQRADGVEEVVTVEELELTFRTLKNCDHASDFVVVESQGSMVATARVTWWDEESGPRVYNHRGFVHPTVRRRGLGGALMGWGRARLAEIAASHPEDRSKVVRVSTEENMVGQVRLLEQLGYRPFTRGVLMVRPLADLPPAQLPPGVEIRPVTFDQLRAIWEADAEAFRDHHGYTAPTEADWQRFLEFPHRDETLWRVAWQGDQVVGQVRSYINQAENAAFGRRRGYTEFISTHRDWRCRGIATALIASSLQALASRGMTEAALGVHTENPTGAFQLYQRLGYRVRQTRVVYQGELA
jgi:ribosomal protein S18 acetylase RimI-like enzyme